MNHSRDYLIKDWSKKGQPALRLVNEEELFQELDKSKAAKVEAALKGRNGTQCTEAGQISVYKIGPCVLDWS